MAMSANVGGLENIYIAVLGDGRSILEHDLHAMATALHLAGVPASWVKHDWHAGQRMLTAGQQVTLYAEIHSLERKYQDMARAA